MYIVCMPNKNESLAKKESKREQRRRNFFQQAFQPKFFGKKRRNYLSLPRYPREKRNNVVKTLKSRKVKASFLIGVLLFAMFSGLYFTLIITNVDVVFNGNKREADVNEDITFSWIVIGSFSKGAILFGDGTSVELNNTSNSVRHSYAVQGKYTPLIHVWNQNGFSTSKALFIEIKNNAPQFEVSVANSAYEDELVRVSVVDIIESEVDLENEVLKYVYDFADNNQTKSNQNSIFHKWKNAGIYPVTITLFDDQSALSQKTEYIEIINKAPVAYFDQILTEGIVEFNAELSVDTDSDLNSLMYIWDFGDNHTAFGKYVNHGYDISGQYTVELCVKDDNGAVDHSSKLINIGSSQTNGTENNEIENVITLDVLGPFTLPQNIEGQMVNLDVEVYDSLENEAILSYTWYDETGAQISNDKCPSILLDDGDYRFILNVTNQNGQVASENITLKVNNIAPEVFVSNYVYNGPNIDSSNEAELLLTAYGYDSVFDINNLKFYWEITDGDTTFTHSDTVGKATSTMIFTCTETAIYRGQVKVVDPSGKESVTTFFVNVVIDNNKNSVPDNIEQLLDVTSESLESFSDADNDYISDECEQFIFNTNFVNPDTDGDGLCDGLDASGIGELSIGTNPLNEDSDYDLLKDSIEFYGWNVTINFFEGSKVLHVSSEPLIYDTDSDGVSDYDEYQTGSNPHLKDSDGDGLEDLLDPYPANFDNDGDFLSDKIELDIGTDLDNTDSDGDGIKDGEEYYGWGLLGFKTSPLNPDCDRDFASDGAEMKFYTIKLENSEKNEIRVNVSNPVSLHFPYMFQKAATAQISVALSFGEHGTNETGEYGIEESNVKNLTVKVKHEGYDALLFETTTNGTRYFSHVIDVSKIMNNDSLSYNYYGNYILEVDDYSTGCLVEQFELEFCRYLDPHAEDFDEDGILDGVEMNLLVEGTEKIDAKDLYNSTQRIVNSTTFNSNYTTAYRLDIPQIGRVSNAQLNLEIESNGQLQPNTYVKFTVVKKYLNRTIGDSVLIDYSQQSTTNNYLLFSQSVNLFDLLQSNTISDVYGEYILIIALESTQAGLDLLALNKFYIEIDTFVEAGLLDTHAWLTDPALFDSDSDGWSDSYEIFTTGTNPISRDTDGDGAADSKDRNPLENIILEISPIYASYRNQAWPTTNPVLKIGIYLQLNDITDPDATEEENKVGFFTVGKHATTDVFVADWYITYQTAWWNGGEGYRYYIDISDDFTTQSNQVQFFFTLWEDAMLGDIDLPDLNRFDGNWYSDFYDLDSPEETQALVAQHTGQFGRTDEILVNVKKITVDKVNTVAIYSKNETLFNGHYQNQERMNVFQLHIIDSGVGTPFVQGANAIVVPTSLFTKTKLNAFIENGLLDQTVLYSDVEGEFEFYSIDRDGNIVDEECGDADFVFVRYQMTSQEAMELLDLLLTCAINQTLDENNQTITDLDVVYSCVSTKLNGTSAVLLNVPNTVSKFILWGGGYEDSLYGNAPNPYNPIFFWLFLLPFVLPIVGLIMIFSLTIISITQFNDNNANGVGLMLLTFLANLVWCLIRAALIVLAYICLALEVIMTSAIFLALGCVFTLLTLFNNISSDWGINWVIPYGVNTKIAFLDITMEGNRFMVEVWINWIYWKFFDMFFPIPIMDFDMDTIIGKPSKEPSPPSLHCGYEQIGGENSTIFNFKTLYKDENGNEPEYVKLNLMDTNGEYTSYTMVNRTEIFNESLILTGIEYNITLDFKQKEPGQYFYYFETKEISDLDYTSRWPVDYYCEPGPFISIDGTPEKYKPYFLFSEVDQRSKFELECINFTVMGGNFTDNLLPNQVYFNILWINGSVQSFPMEIIDSYIIQGSEVPDVSLLTYSVSINISKYIDIEAPLSLRFFYSAELDNGETTIYFDSQLESENVENLDGFKKKWFLGPTIIPEKTTGPPQIIGWKVEEVLSDTIYDSRTNSLSIIGPTIDEHVLRFWVYVSDPDGSHEDHQMNGFEFQPKLKLTNLNNPLNQETIIPLAWAGNEYEPYLGVDAYFVDLLPSSSFTYDHENFTDCDFNPGAWTFSYIVSDSSQNTETKLAKIGSKPLKIWSIGRLSNVWFTAMNGYNSAGFLLDNIIPGAGLISSIGMTIAYSLAGLLSLMGEKCKTVARFIAIGIAIYDLVSTFSSWIGLCFTEDTGTLLGLALSCIMTSAGIALAHKIGTINSKIFNFKNLFLMKKITYYTFLINLILTIYCNPTVLINGKVMPPFILLGSGDEFDWDAPGEDFLRSAPINVLTFFISIMGLGAILNIASIKTVPAFGMTNDKMAFGSVSCPVLQITKYHTIIKLVFSAMCFITFMIKTGMFHIIGDITTKSLIL